MRRNTILNQLMQLLHNKGFWQIVNKYDGDRYCKKLSYSQELAILLFSMIKDLMSLRYGQMGSYWYPDGSSQHTFRRFGAEAVSDI